MSRALSVYHGRFGRATLYELNRPMTTHAHREGHLIFHLGGAPATAPGERHVLHGLTDALCGRGQPVGAARRSIAERSRAPAGSILVLYIDRSWFAAHGSDAAGCRACFGRSEIEMTPANRCADARNPCRCSKTTIPRTISTATLFELTDACFEQSWRLAGGWQRYCGRHPPSSTSGFASRSLLMSEEARLARSNWTTSPATPACRAPHFYKLFRRQTGVTPNIYLNTLRMDERPCSVLGADQPVDHRDRR